MSAEKPRYDVEVDKDATRKYALYAQAAKNYEQALAHDKALERIDEIDDLKFTERVAHRKEKKELEKSLPPEVKEYDKYFNRTTVRRPYEVEDSTHPNGSYTADALETGNFGPLNRTKSQMQAMLRYGTEHYKANESAIQENAEIEANMDFVSRGSNQRIRTRDVVEQQVKDARRITPPDEWDESETD